MSDAEREEIRKLNERRIAEAKAAGQNIYTEGKYEGLERGASGGQAFFNQQNKDRRKTLIGEDGSQITSLKDTPKIQLDDQMTPEERSALQRLILNETMSMSPEEMKMAKKRSPEEIEELNKQRRQKILSQRFKKLQDIE